MVETLRNNGSLAIRYSVVVPIYKNFDTLPLLLERLNKIAKSLRKKLEVVFVIDGSPDQSKLFLMQYLPQCQFKSRIVSHSRNFGSFDAVRTGLRYSSGEFIAVMAADLQEPHDLVEKFFHSLEANEGEIAIGTRVSRHDPIYSKLFSNMYWYFYRKLVFKEIPKGGIDVFAVKRQVAMLLIEFTESNSSLIGQLMWSGFRRIEIPYERQKRVHGKSSWTFSRKFKYLSDSIFSFTSLPIKLILILGVFGTLVFSLIAITVFIFWFFGKISVPGYSALMIVQLLSSASLLFAMGVIGSYIWRTYDNSKMRPSSIVMDVENF